MLLLLLEVESLSGRKSTLFAISIWIRLRKENISLSFFIRKSIYYVHVCAHARTPFIHTATATAQDDEKLGHIVVVQLLWQAGREASTVSWKEKHKFTFISKLIYA